MSRRKPTSKEEQSQILTLHAQGYKSRAIAELVLGSQTKKSTVNDIIARSKKEGTTAEEEEEVSSVESLCSHPDWDIANLAKRLRTAQRTNNQLRKIQRDAFDKADGDLLSDTLNAIALKVAAQNPPLKDEKLHKSSTKKTVEILFSDLQIGKKSQFYNTEVAGKALTYYGKEVLAHVKRTKPEKLILSFLGDLVEDHLKHGVQSAVSTDTSLAEQMANCIALVWHRVLAPLVATGIPMEVIGIAGNHGSSEHKGMDSFKAGRFAYDYAIYKSWQVLCDTIGAKHVTFNIPEGCFATCDIYGHTYLYEHGYSNGVGSEKQMLDHKKKRSENLKKYIHGFRCADKHHSVAFDNANLVCNGAFFGVEMEGAEYSGIMGFNSIPVQGLFVHEAVNGVGQSTITESVWIQIAKGY